MAIVEAQMIRLLGFDSQPYPRLQLEFTDADIEVLEWLKGRTYKLPALADDADLLDNMIGRSPETPFGKTVAGFLQRLHDSIGHIRCCVDPSRGR